VYPNNKYWIIKPGETKIVGMEIYADKYSSEKSYMFKITLTKAENDDYKDLRQSVDIKQISSLQEGVR
jgi:hypothetical protein